MRMRLGHRVMRGDWGAYSTGPDRIWDWIAYSVIRRALRLLVIGVQRRDSGHAFKWSGTDPFQRVTVME
jgi:hypothetical protein